MSRHRTGGPAARPTAHPTASPTDRYARRTTRAVVRDRGLTLIEVVITVILMGTVVIAILNAVATTVSASATSRSAAQIETALVNAADRVNRAPKSCDYTIYAQAAVQVQGWPAGSATVTHQYYIPGADAKSTGSWAVGPPATPGCAGAATTDLIVQRVTINLTTPDGKIRRTIQVVKSDV